VLTAVYPSKARPAFPWEAWRAPADYGRAAEPNWRDIDWSRYHRRIRVAGRQLSYVELGEGEEPPVVFVHGLGGNWQNWLENLPRVGQDRRVVAVDLPGFGDSEMPADKISIGGYARWVEELCQRLELGPVVVVGSSMGGFIGAEMAISYPQRVERLVLTAAAGISSANLHRTPTLTVARMTTAFGTFTAARAPEIVTRPRLRHVALSPVVRHPSRLATDLLLEVMQGSGKPGYVAALDALLSYDFRDRLPEIGCPTLLIWGEEDILVPVADADEFERLIPDSTKVVLEETGHGPMFERPEAFNGVLLNFLTATGATRRAEQAAVA